MFNELLELICLHIVKWFQVLLSNTNNSMAKLAAAAEYTDCISTVG